MYHFSAWSALLSETRWFDAKTAMGWSSHGHGGSIDVLAMASNLVLGIISQFHVPLK